jgi:hypothetical protein
MPFLIDGVQLDELSSDPSTPTNGQLWYNSTVKRFKLYLDSVTHEIAHVDDLEAGNIVVNATGFTGILSATDDDVQAALATIDQRIFTGSSTPSSTTDGALWYHTGTGWKTLMAYDASRTKWLSVEEFTLAWGRSAADGVLLGGPGVTEPGSGSGILIPRNCCVKRITSRTTSDNVLKRLDLYVNGSTAMNWSLVDATSSSTYKSNAVNQNLAEDDYVWVYVDSALGEIANVTTVLWCSWRV